MPTYDYRCPLCGHSFEQLVHRTTEAVFCPHCDREGNHIITMRLFSLGAPAFRVKGYNAKTGYSKKDDTE